MQHEESQDKRCFTKKRNKEQQKNSKVESVSRLIALILFEGEKKKAYLSTHTKTNSTAAASSTGGK